jgi:hypothetical protein
MVVTVEMDNGLCAMMEIDELLIDSANYPVFYIMNTIQKMVSECVERRNEKAPE